MHHIMIMPDLSHLVIIVHRLFILVLRFFADRTDELMRATTSSPVFRHVFQASIPSSATYFIALPLSIMLALCYDALVVSILLFFTLQPIYCLPSTTYYQVLSVSLV